MGVRNCEELGVNLQKITNRLLENKELLKLLYYTDQDPLSETKAVPDKNVVLGDYLSIKPYLGTQLDAHSKVVVYVQKASKLASNNEFKMVRILVDVIVPLTQWAIKDTNMRIFAILGHIQESLDGKTVNGLGKIKGGDFELNFTTDEVCCYQQVFEITEYD